KHCVCLAVALDFFRGVLTTGHWVVPPRLLTQPMIRSPELAQNTSKRRPLSLPHCFQMARSQRIILKYLICYSVVLNGMLGWLLILFGISSFFDFDSFG